VTAVIQADAYGNTATNRVALPRESPWQVGKAVFWIGTWPLLWVAWAFLFRGGFCFRVMGLTLVRTDGRPAERWRCAWRALLVWLPVATLALLAAFLEMGYWSLWDVHDPYAWLLWLSDGCWWVALGLPVAYILMALGSPGRTLHDRLAGTYLVPR
jgi:hypothetical protein